MLGHDHVAGYVKTILLAHPLQRALEGVTVLHDHKFRLPVIATEGDEVEMLRVLKPAQSRWHRRTILRELIYRM